MLNKGPHRTGGAFWTQCEAALSPVRKRVHLLFHYICVLSHSPLKELAELKDGSSNFSVTILLGQQCGQILQTPESLGLLGQKVPCPPGCSIHNNTSL